MYVQDELARSLGSEALRAGGLTVTTTLDLDLQQAVERSISRSGWICSTVARPASVTID